MFEISLSNCSIQPSSNNHHSMWKEPERVGQKKPQQTQQLLLHSCLQSVTSKVVWVQHTLVTQSRNFFGNNPLLSVILECDPRSCFTNFFWENWIKILLKTTNQIILFVIPSCFFLKISCYSRPVWRKNKYLSPSLLSRSLVMSASHLFIWNCSKSCVQLARGVSLKIQIRCSLL